MYVLTKAEVYARLVEGGGLTFLTLLWGHGQRVKAAPAGAGVRRPAFCSLVRMSHIFSSSSPLRPSVR